MATSDVEFPRERYYLSDTFFANNQQNLVNICFDFSTEKKKHIWPLRNLFYFSTAQNWEILGKKLWYSGFVLVPRCAEQDKLPKTAFKVNFQWQELNVNTKNIFVLNNILMPNFWQNMYNNFIWVLMSIFWPKICTSLLRPLK